MVKFIPNTSPKNGSVLAYLEIKCKCGEELIRVWKKGVKVYKCSNCNKIIKIIKKKE